MPKITLGITGLHEILSQDYGIKGPYWGPSTECDFYLKLSNNTIQKHNLNSISQNTTGSAENHG